MNNITFDLKHESNIHYGDDYEYQISVSTIDGQPSTDYKICWHIVSMNKLKNGFKFNIKLKQNNNQIGTSKTETIITLDLNGLMKNDYKLSSIRFYYRKVNVKLIPIAVTIITEPQRPSFGHTEQLNYSYRYRELIRNENEIILDTLTEISFNKILDKKDLDDEYKALATILNVNLLDLKCNYKSIEININSNVVNAKGPENVENWTEFFSYKYVVSELLFNKIEFENNYNESFEFNEFNGLDYNNTNLSTITAYYISSDKEKKIPLLIQFKPRLGHRLNGTDSHSASVFYELCDTVETRIETSNVEDGVTPSVKIFYQYKKVYKKFTFPQKTKISDHLKTIYKTQKVEEKLERMIPTPEKQIRSGGSSIPGIVAGVLGLISIPAGVLGYIHFRRIISTLRSLRHRFSYLYH